MVVAPDIPELVTVIGGWLFDRAMAGWDVTALVNEDSDVRPLRILGVGAAELDSVLSAYAPAFPAGVVSFAGHHYSSDPRTRELIRRVMDSGAAELIVWGDVCPAEFRARLLQVSYEPTIAAQVFKKHALVAVGRPDRGVDARESFRCGVRPRPAVAQAGSLA